MDMGSPSSEGKTHAGKGSPTSRSEAATGTAAMVAQVNNVPSNQVDRMRKPSFDMPASGDGVATSR